MRATLLATNVLNRGVSLWIYANATWLSVQKVDAIKSMSTSPRINASSLTASRHAVNSNLGILTGLVGARRPLIANKATCTRPVTLVVLIYAHAPYAHWLTSQKKCSSETPSATACGMTHLGKCRLSRFCSDINQARHLVARSSGTGTSQSNLRRVASWNNIFPRTVMWVISPSGSYIVAILLSIMRLVTSSRAHTCFMT